MNKAELIEHLAAQHALSKAESGRIVQTLLDTIVTTVKKGGSVVIPGFGSFKLHARAARNGVNPATGAKIKIAAAKLPKFTPGATFKATVDPKGAARKAAKAAPAKTVTKVAAKVATKAPVKAAAKAPVKTAVKTAVKAVAKAAPAKAPAKVAEKAPAKKAKKA